MFRKTLIVTVWSVSWLCSMIDTQTKNALHAFNDEEQPRHFNKSSNLDVQCMSLRINGIQAYGYATIINKLLYLLCVRKEYESM